MATTTIDGDNKSIMLGVTAARVIVLGGLAYLISSWIFGTTVGVVVGAAVALLQLMNGSWAVSTGATTCHSCGTTFETR